jgi:hypothetical protein
VVCLRNRFDTGWLPGSFTDGQDRRRLRLRPVKPHGILACSAKGFTLGESGYAATIIGDMSVPAAVER